MFSAAALAVKIVAMGSVGIGMGSLMKLFHAYEWKPAKKGVIQHDEGESLRERAKRIS